MLLDRFLSPYDEQQLSQLLAQHLNDSSLSGFEKKSNAFNRRMIFSPSAATATTLLSSREPITPDSGKTNWITLFARLSHPFSRGSTPLLPSDPAVKPKVDFQCYSHPLNLEVYARHHQILESIADTAPLSGYIKPYKARLPPNSGPASLKRAKKEIRDYSCTNYHP